MSGEWTKAAFTTGEEWRAPNVNVLVFYRGMELFIPATSLGQALGINPETIPSKFISLRPDDCDIDKRVKNVVTLPNLKPCMRAVLDRLDNPPSDEAIGEMIQSIYEAVRGDDGDDEDDEDDEVEDVKKRPRDDDDLVERLARRVEDIIKPHLRYENQQAAAVILFNSPEFQARKEEMIGTKLTAISKQLEDRAAQLAAEAEARWRQETLPKLRVEWERQAREEVRQTVLPKLREEQLQEQAMTVARQVIAAQYQKTFAAPSDERLQNIVDKAMK